MSNLKENPCKRCGVPFSADAFYHKGNILLHCNECRENMRMIKQKEIQKLLELEKQFS